jgi:ParB-like chromosome segregation protein Spo0J
MKEFHPLANIFPQVEGPEFADLVADIREHGLYDPIVMFEDRVLDGRNRLRACKVAGVEPVFTVYTGDDPVAFVVRINLHRRHLDESQRAMVAVKLATLLRAGDNQHSEGLRIGRSSELLNVGERSVARAREVQEHGTPELVHAVERGAVSVSAAADVATLSAQEQREIVARGEREILRASQDIRARKAEIRPSTRTKIGAGGELIDCEKGRCNPTVDTDRLGLANQAGSLSLALDAADTIQAQDSLEKMLVHQMAVLHSGMMRAAARMNEELDAAGVIDPKVAAGMFDLNKREAAEAANVRACRLAGAISRLSATYQQGLLTLQRKRTGGNQQVTVKHIHQQVNVTQGGQAVVAGDKVTSRTRGRRGSDGGGMVKNER